MWTDVPVPVRRAGYRTAHALLRGYWRVVRPHTEGVKCVVREGDAVIFVRHTYGERHCWELPGGGIKRREAPHDAAAREAAEELGVDVAQWRPLGAVEVHGYGKRTTIHCFEGRPEVRELTVDAGEIDEAGWFDPADPPVPLCADARTILARLLSGGG